MVDLNDLIKEALQAAAQPPTRPEPTSGEYAIAFAVAGEVRDKLRFAEHSRQWMTYEDGIWKPISTNRAAEVVVQAAEEYYLREIAATTDKDEKKRLSKLLEQAYRARTITGVLFFVAGQAGIATRPDEWDRGDMLLPVANGVIDLTDGSLKPHDPSYLFTKQAGTIYDPTAKADRWEQFLDEVFLGDKDLIAFVQRAVGYSLTALTREQCFFFLFGTGRNGKSRFLESILALMGGLGKYAAFSTFTRERGKNGHEDDLMSLEGARLVASSESKTVGKLAEDVLKTLAGEDPITGSRKGEKTYTYRPKFKVWLAANNKPRVDDVTDGFWRKVILIPFEAKFEGAAEDKRLGEKLKAELPGILAWAVRGCLAYQAEGLNPPQKCIDAVAAWRADNDPLSDFITTCKVGAGLEVKASVLYQAYEQFCAINGVKPISMTAFSPLIEAHGFKREVRRNGKFFVGIGL